MSRANPTSFAILFFAANNQLQSLSAEDDVLSSAGRDQIAADEDEREQDQGEIERREWDERPGAGVLLHFAKCDQRVNAVGSRSKARVLLGKGNSAVTRVKERPGFQRIRERQQRKEVRGEDGETKEVTSATAFSEKEGFARSTRRQNRGQGNIRYSGIEKARHSNSPTRQVLKLTPLPPLKYPAAKSTRRPVLV